MTREPNHAVLPHPAVLSRRVFLRGLGASIALPAFASLGTSRFANAAAADGAGGLAATATGTPLRSAFVYFPNGAIPSAWWPGGEGTDFQFKRTLQPLEPVKDLVQVLGGLDLRTAEGGPDGAGDHARGNGTFLTGVRLKKSATAHPRRGLDRPGDRASDRPPHAIPVAGAGVRGRCGRPGRAIPGIPAPTSTTSPGARPRRRCRRSRTRGWPSSGSSAPARPGERQANLERRRQEQRSILDFALEDARAMQRRLGSEDREKLDQYLDGVREIETRIEQAPSSFGAGPRPGRRDAAGRPGRLRGIRPAHVRHAASWRSRPTRRGWRH